MLHSLFLLIQTYILGLPYMLSKNYFNDAFILHDETFIFERLNAYNLDLFENKKNKQIREEHNKNTAGLSDKRKELDEEWAQFKNIIRFQPLMKIRNYFGEIVALYFAWCGTVITTLWIISLIGIIFFFIGLINSINNQSALKVSQNSTAVEKYAFKLFILRDCLFVCFFLV